MRRWILLLVVVACSASRDQHDVAIRPVESTITARDYIGPAACGECHGEQYAQWQTSLHRVMNQRAEDDAIIAPDGATLAYRGGTVRLTGDAMVFERGAQAVRYRLTRTIGHRGLQEFVGVVDGTTEEVRLPVGWWPVHGGLYPQAFFDPWLAEDDVDIYAPARAPWAERCPWCHSTYPFEARIARSSGPRALGHGLEQYFVGPPAGTRLPVAQQVTTGISCESCHLGGRAHAAGASIHFVPLGAEAKPGAPAATAFSTERLDAGIVNTVCAQCHSGPSPRLADGSATRNSSEALDLAASPCTARCTSCHDPHRGGASEQVAVAACVGCHAVGEAHGGHADVSCLDCHMPKITMGIDRYVRSHRISSPTNPALLAAAAPNACNLCHLDRSIRWTLAALERDVGNLDAYGDPDEPVGTVWLASTEPDVRVMAAMAYARGKLGRAALAEILPLLDDARPYVRAWTQLAVRAILGKPLAGYDARAASPARRAAISKLRRE